MESAPRVGALAIALALAGCGGSVVTENVAYGPYRGEDEGELFERVVSAVRARGYRVLDADETAGHFAVRSHTVDPRGGRTIFRFHFYRGGWVGVEALGGSATRRLDGKLIMTAALHREYAALVGGLLEPADRRSR